MSDDTSTQDEQEETAAPSEGAAAGTPSAGSTEEAATRSERTGPDRSLRIFVVGFLAVSAVVVVLAFVIEATAG